MYFYLLESSKVIYFWQHWFFMRQNYTWVEFAEILRDNWYFDEW